MYTKCRSIGADKKKIFLIKLSHAKREKQNISEANCIRCGFIS